MKPFRSAGGKTYKLRLFTDEEKPVDRTTGTRDLSTAKAMGRALASVRERKRYALVWTALRAGHVEVEEVWLAHERGELDALVERLGDIDVEPLVVDWFAHLKGKVAEDTRQHYRAAVRLLLPEGVPFLRSALTSKRLQKWVDDMECSPATQLKRGRGMGRFTAWLKKPSEVLERDPMVDVELPPPGKPRDKHLSTPEAIVLADRQPGQFRLLSALLAGTGLDVSTALALTKRSVEVATREIDAPGTKTHNRDRIVRVADWAWPYVEEAIRGKLPGARLFDAIPDRWVARDAHRAAVDSLVAEGHTLYAGYWMRDARHTWAVRAMRAGMPPELIARQLGHKDATLVLKVYGKYMPRSDERAHWEKVATARDEARASQGGMG